MLENVVILMAPNTRACSPQRESAVLELLQRGRVSNIYVRFAPDNGAALLRKSLPSCVIKQVRRHTKYTLYKITKVGGSNDPATDDSAA